MAPTKDAVEFNRILQTERDKKKKQDLADRIFGQRRSSAPAAGVVGARKPPTGPKSLGSRINGGPTGVSKPSRAARPARPSHAMSGVGRLQNGHSSLQRSVSTPQLNQNNHRRNQALDTAFNGRANSSKNVNDQVNTQSRPASNGAGISIRGLSSQAQKQYLVIAQNFAPGTTAEDIESVFAPDPDANGLVSCKLVVSSPTVIAEVVFNNQDAAEEVVNTYNGKKADNRILYVYHQDQQNQRAPQPRAAPRSIPRHQVLGVSSDDASMEVDEPRPYQPYSPPRGPKSAKPVVQDGRYGFEEDYEDTRSQGQQQSGNGLVSDSMIAPRNPRTARYGRNW